MANCDCNDCSCSDDDLEQKAFDRGYADGHDDGYEDGRHDGEEELNDREGSLKDTFTQIENILWAIEDSGAGRMIPFETDELRDLVERLRKNVLQ